MSRSLHWRPPNPWTVKVHAGMLESGACLTPEQIKVMYGVPKGGVGIATLLDISGNFEALHGGRWRAVDRLEERKPKWLTLERMGQVPSVFHLR